MATADVSSDEGEIIEATSLPRSTESGDVDRPGRTSGRSSRTPDYDVSTRNSGDGARRRDVSPRGFKRSRDERDHQINNRARDPRRFRVHYEADSRDDTRRNRLPYDDLDRPSSRGSHHGEDMDQPRSPGSNFRSTVRDTSSRSQTNYRQSGFSRDRDFNHHDSYPDKRTRNRSRSPKNRRDKGTRERDQTRDYRDRFARDAYRDQPESIKYSSQNERQAQGTSAAKQNTRADASISHASNAKSDQGATVDHTNRSALSLRNKDAPETSEQNAEPEPDWDEVVAVDREAAMEAEILRRRRAREEAYKRGVGAATPTIQALQASTKQSASTPGSTRLNTPVRTEVNTPRSEGHSPTVSAGGDQDGISPAAFEILNDQDLINTHGEVKVNDEDGPSAADYDPTADMKEDERRYEMRHGNVGLHGQERSPIQDAEPSENVGETAADDDDNDDFDMFADNIGDDDDEPAPKAPAKAQPALQPQETQAVQVNEGGILEGDDKDGYYKIRPGEILAGRYQVQSTLGRGMFSGVARAVDITTKRLVAIKIMRNNDALRKGGFTEIAILQKLNDADPDNKRHVIKFERSFEYKGHLCMVFENLSLNLREVLKKFGNNIGINLNATRAYAYQIFLALGHMRKCSVIHADLKPDNILVNENRNTLKVCDLGTAIDRSDAATAHNEITPYLVSRFYRAPEIILGMPYDYAIDMWSIGCTLYELYTGKILFTGDSNNQMLKNIMEIRGKLSGKLYRRGQLSNLHFDEVGNFVSIERDKVLGKTNIRTLPMVKPTRDLRVRLLAASSGMTDAETRELNHFADLLERCLSLNPDKRINPVEALKHPFFTQRLHSSGRGA